MFGPKNMLEVLERIEKGIKDTAIELVKDRQKYYDYRDAITSTEEELRENLIYHLVELAKKGHK